MREVVRGDALPPCVRAARGKLHTWTRKGLGTRRGANDGCIHIKGFLHVSISILFFRLQCSISYCSYDCAMCNSYAYTVSVPPETATLRTPTCGTLWYLWNFRKQIQLSQIAIRYRKIQLSQDWYMWWLRFMHSDPMDSSSFRSSSAICATATYCITADPFSRTNVYTSAHVRLSAVAKIRIRVFISLCNARRPLFAAVLDPYWDKKIYALSTTCLHNHDTVTKHDACTIVRGVFYDVHSDVHHCHSQPCS